MTGAEVEHGAGSAMCGGGVVQVGSPEGEEGGFAQCSGDCVGALIGEVQ